jgi:hypothetical protein
MRNPYMIHPLFSYIRYDAPWHVSKTLRTVKNIKTVDGEYRRFLKAYPTCTARVKEMELDMLSKYAMMHAYGFSSE